MSEVNPYQSPAIIYGIVASRMVAPTRITKDYVWLKGVHPDFLAELPPWQYNL